eukprot:TRINITY_DN8687_c0_g2_i9.p2 TRINITY_DN8687_c0_g2~~TRINITY_DN8687_c0_g2_i9.p2  ORF type:complete len:181 (-),score=37.37 TRINITY_DN8687_c0_g2_i9:109-651(-)
MCIRDRDFTALVVQAFPAKLKTWIKSALDFEQDESRACRIICVRIFVNLFQTKKGREFIEVEINELSDLFLNKPLKASDKTAQAAIFAFLYNITVPQSLKVPQKLLNDVADTLLQAIGSSYEERIISFSILGLINLVYSNAEIKKYIQSQNLKDSFERSRGLIKDDKMKLAVDDLEKLLL